MQAVVNDRLETGPVLACWAMICIRHAVLILVVQAISRLLRHMYSIATGSEIGLTTSGSDHHTAAAAAAAQYQLDNT